MLDQLYTADLLLPALVISCYQVLYIKAALMQSRQTTTGVASVSEARLRPSYIAAQSQCSQAGLAAGQPLGYRDFRDDFRPDAT